MRHSLEIADVQFEVYDKCDVFTSLEHVVLIFPNFSLSDSSKQLCCVVFFRNICAGGYIIISQAEELSLLCVASVKKIMAQSKQ